MILGLLSERDAYSIGHKFLPIVLLALCMPHNTHTSCTRVLVQSCMMYINVIQAARYSHTFNSTEYTSDRVNGTETESAMVTMDTYGKKEPMYHKNSILH